MIIGAWGLKAPSQLQRAIVSDGIFMGGFVTTVLWCWLVFADRPAGVLGTLIAALVLAPAFGLVVGTILRVLAPLIMNGYGTLLWASDLLIAVPKPIMNHLEEAEVLEYRATRAALERRFFVIRRCAAVYAAREATDRAAISVVTQMDDIAQAVIEEVRRSITPDSMPERDPFLERESERAETSIRWIERQPLPDWLLRKLAITWQRRLLRKK